MVIYKCDRCGIEMKKPKYFYFPKSEVVIGDMSTTQIDGKTVLEYMLCQKCSCSFANWFCDDFLYNEYSKPSFRD